MPIFASGLDLIEMNDHQHTKIEKRLATGKIGSLIARYSIPGAITLVFFSIQSMVDGIIVGNWLGADALASVSLILPAYTIPSSIALVLGIGAQAQMSIALGEQDYTKAKTALKTGMSLSESRRTIHIMR